MGQLIRTRSVLALVEGDAPVLDNPVLQPDGTTVHTMVACHQYRYTDDDIADNPDRARHVFLDVESTVDLGTPDEITVTIEPGDRLNGDWEARFEPRQREDGRWGWVLVHRNGNVLVSEFSQGYENEAEAAEIGWKVVSGQYLVTGP